MERLLDVINGPIGRSAAWTLVHTLWQGPVLAAILYILLKSHLWPRPQVRYGAGLASLLLVVLAACFTFAVLSYESPAAPPESDADAALASTAVLSGLDGSAAAISKLPVEGSAGDESVVHGGISWYAVAVILWAAGVAAMTARATALLAGVSQLKHSCRPLEDARVLAVFEGMRTELRVGRRIGIAVCERIASPAVVGFVRPVVLVPASMLMGMDPDALRAILAHELAHIRRWDYLVNLLQITIESILFFNPAVWWISRQVRIEREACCDAEAAAATGHELRYAKVLAGWVERMVAGPASGAALAFGKADPSGDTAERVKRLVQPHHRPTVKWSWHVFTALLLGTVLLLAGLLYGANQTVQLAAKVLTPRQRIDRMAQIQQSHGPMSTLSEGQVERVLLSGTVSTWDGNPLPQGANVNLYYSYGNSSGTVGMTPNRVERPGAGERCSWSHSVAPGIAWVQAWAPGYGAAAVGPLRPQPGKDMSGIDLVLPDGFEGVLQFVDEAGVPVPDVALEGGYAVRPGGFSYTLDLKGDDAGIIRVPHAVDIPISFRVDAPGYAMAEFKQIQLVPDEAVQLTLEPAAPTWGQVVARETGEPIPGASVLMLARAYLRGNHSFGLENGRFLARTDASGRFVLDSLRADSRYTLAFEAPGFGRTFREGVTAGQEEMLVELPLPRVLSGRIIGPLANLPERDGELVMPYVHILRSGTRPDVTGVDRSKPYYAPVEVQGETGYFAISGFLGNLVTIGADHYEKSLRIDTIGAEPVVIDLSEPQTATGEKYGRRTVVLVFDTPEGTPPPEGSIPLNYMDPSWSSTTYCHQIVPIENGRAALEIPVPGKIAYGLNGIVGYWIRARGGIEVPRGVAPFEVHVRAVPAGSIFGEVFDPDGSEATRTMVSVSIAEKSPLMGETGFLDVDPKPGTSSAELATRYSASPLPLDGAYVIVAHRDQQYIASEPVRLTEQQPVREVNLTFEPGVDIPVQVVLPGGGPATQMKVLFDLDLTQAGGYNHTLHTNDDGRLLLKSINPNIEGVYRLEVRPQKDYRPQRVQIRRFHEPITIRLEHGAAVEGRVIDEATGWPVPEADVWTYFNERRDGKVVDYERIEAEAKTDELGRFRISTMKPGRRYTLRVVGASGVHSADVEVTAGQSEPVQIPVEILSWSQLKPRKPDDGR